jgi:hypothetical protein
MRFGEAGPKEKLALHETEGPTLVRGHSLAA